MYYLFKSPRYTDKLHIRYCMNLTEFKEKILNLLNESGRDWEVKSDDGFNIAVLTKDEGSFIIKLEIGRNTPDIETLWELADIFDITIDELVGRE